MQGFDVLCGPTVLVVTGPVIVSGIAAAVPGRATVSAIAKVPARLSFRMFTLSPHHGVEVQTCSISRAHQRLVWPSVKRNLCRTGIPMFRNTRFQKSLGKATKVAMTRFRRRNQDIHSDFGRPSLGGKPRNLRLRRLSWRPAARRSSQVYVEHAATLNHRPRRRHSRQRFLPARLLARIRACREEAAVCLVSGWLVTRLPESWHMKGVKG